MDLHASQIQGFFDVPVDNVSLSFGEDVVIQLTNSYTQNQPWSSISVKELMLKTVSSFLRMLVAPSGKLVKLT